MIAKRKRGTFFAVAGLGLLLLSALYGRSLWRSAPIPFRWVAGGQHLTRASGGIPQTTALSRGVVDHVLQAASKAYAAGRYGEAEANALRVVQELKDAKDATHGRKVATARYILAYSSARRGDKRTARVRFAALRADAAKLPDKGLIDAGDSAVPLTLEEEGAYQHAVLTATLENRDAAVREYEWFMRTYPGSPRIHNIVLRLESLHGGRLTDSEEHLWRAAQRAGIAQQMVRARAQAMCGPECLAELLRRKGRSVDLATLAKQMKTTDRGTTMSDLARVAGQYGYKSKGMALTEKGLKRQTMPAIAYLSTGHFVVIENAGWLNVRIWDPSKDSGRGASVSYDYAAWRRTWTGATLVLA